MVSELLFSTKASLAAAIQHSTIMNNKRSIAYESVTILNYTVYHETDTASEPTIYSTNIKTTNATAAGRTRPKTEGPTVIRTNSKRQSDSA